MKKKLGALTVLACAYAAFGLEISPVLEGKMAAFSFTYDDGAYSHYTTALPMHLKYGMPATFFIITDRVEQDGEGRAKKYCSWAEVKEMAGKGMEMASHTKTHRNMRDLESAGLTKEMMKGKTRAELFAMREPNWPTVWSEIELSREALESHTGQKVRTYAFAGNAYPDWTGRIAEKPKDICAPGEIWLRLAPGEKVEVNGKPAAPNAQNAVLAHTGDTIIAISPGVL